MPSWKSATAETLGSNRILHREDDDESGDAGHPQSDYSQGSGERSVWLLVGPMAIS